MSEQPQPTEDSALPSIKNAALNEIYGLKAEVAPKGGNDSEQHQLDECIKAVHAATTKKEVDAIVSRARDIVKNKSSDYQ